MEIREGYMPYLGYKTYYRITGHTTGNKKPLVCLHGGPGSTHNYFEVFDSLAEEDGRMIVMYDQIGCGNSYLDGHPELWTPETWVNELIELRKFLKLDECHLIGQSWGSMLALLYAIDYKHEGISSIVLSSGHPSSKIWTDEQARMRKELPIEMQEAINRAIATGNYEDEGYKVAVDEYMLRHGGGAPDENSPECLRRPKKFGHESYLYGWGPNEFNATGSLWNYDVVDKLCEVKEPTLVVSGGNDLCTPYVAKVMYDGIPNAKWELFRTARHTCFVEDTEKYIVMLKKWLNEND